MNNKDKRQKIKELEGLAAEVKKLKNERDSRRPLLIEFCGSPKAGKSTTIASLNLFLRRNKFKTTVLSERASVCPISSKTHPFFNIWTMTSAVSEMIASIDQGIGELDIIIADRGIFDALCWFEWLFNNKFLVESEYKKLKEFIFMETWQDYLELVYVFKVDPDTSIKREYANLLTEKRGSIMRESRLQSFNDSIDRVMKDHSNQFRNIIEINTATEENDDDPNAVGYQVTKSILDILKDLLIEKIGYFDQILANQLHDGINPIELIKNLSLNYDNRDLVEVSEHIQPIAIAVVTNPERTKVLIVKKSARRTPQNSPESNRLLLYVGGHVRKEDEKGVPNTMTTIQKTLRRELQEEIGLSRSVENCESFLIYSSQNEKSKRHLAVCFVIEMDLDEYHFKLTSDELTMNRGKSESGQTMTIKKLISRRNLKLEDWSTNILSKVFKVKESIDLFSDNENVKY